MDPKEIDAQIAALKAEIASLQVMKSRASAPAGEEMTMKELARKLGDPRAELLSDDPVSKADRSKAIPSESQYLKEQEDKQALFESLDRAEALAEPEAAEPEEALEEALEDFDPYGEEPRAPEEAPEESFEDFDPYGEEPRAPEEPTPAALEELFKDAHGGPFDPKSKTDLRKMGEIKQLLAEQGGQGDMTNNQFALKLYRRFNYV
jgi:ribosomal protein L29|tara:strand:+ start:5457 stop:6074 length:618 start_codon:yes stop_codon:yes gene_type:complete